MFYMLGHSIKRLSREGLKSLSVPLIAFMLVVLINLLGGVRAWLEYEYEDTMDNFPVIAELSNLEGSQTDGLHIEMRQIKLFTDPDAFASLARHTSDLMLKRTFGAVEVTGFSEGIDMIGITSVRADSSLAPDFGVEVTFFEGYDDSALATDELFGLINEELYPLTENGILRITIKRKLPDEIKEIWTNPQPGRVEVHYINGEPVYLVLIELYPGFKSWEPFDPGIEITVIEGEVVTTEVDLTVIGTILGTGSSVIYSPFWAVSELGTEIDGEPPFSERLNVTIYDNRELSAFKGAAFMNFPRVRPLHDSRPFAMTIYDSVFYETVEPLRQNMIVIDVATPFIYLLSIAVGFLTSVLLTRRRKPEFAVMRSIGVHRRVIFISALTEQALLSIAGVAVGFVFVAIAWGYASLTRPAIFLACYLLGAIFSAASAAGTNVMQVLRDRRE